MKEIKYSQLVNAVIFTVLLVFCLSKTREAIKVSSTDLNDNSYPSYSLNIPKNLHSTHCDIISSFNCTRSHSLQYKALMYSIGMIFLTLSWIITQGWIFLELFSFIYTKWCEYLDNIEI